MAKLDEIKEQIGLNKFIMGLVLIIIFSIRGFAMNEILMYMIAGAFLFFIFKFVQLSKKLVDSE